MSELVRVEHGHGGNEWSPMEEVPPDAAQDDVERQWSRHRIFRCTTCDEQIRVEVPEPGREE